MDQVCARFDVIERDPFWRDPGKRLTGHLSHIPRDIIRGYSREMEALAAEISGREHFDLLVASCLDAAPYIARLPNAPANSGGAQFYDLLDEGALPGSK